MLSIFNVWKSKMMNGRKKEVVLIGFLLAVVVYIARIRTRYGQAFRGKDNLVQTSPSSYDTTQYQTIHTTPVTTSPNQHFIICEASGRFGNLMFTFASLYGIAKRKNMRVAIDASNPLLKHFNLDAKVVNITALHGYKRLSEKIACDYDMKLLDFEPNTDVAIGRFLQSWKYFLHVEDLVRRQFEFSAETLAKINMILTKLRTERMKMVGNANVTIVGIHYRRGDKVHTYFKNFGYQPAPLEYLHKAMDYFRLFHDHLVFLLASDSLDYIKEHLHGEDIVFLENNTAIEDMATMAKCDHLITSVGSYSWWAGFLNKGKVLYYKYPAREGSQLRKDFNYPNHFHPNWTGLI